MDRGFSSGALATPPAVPASPSIGYPTSGNASTGTPATKPGPWWYYMMTEEVRNVIAAAGLTPNLSDVSQLQKAIAALFQAQTNTAFTTTGATGAFVLTPSPAIAAYVANQRFRVKFHAAGNGLDTINISGLGNKNLKQYDAAGNKVPPVIASQLADLEFDGTDVVILDPLPSRYGYPAYHSSSLSPSGYKKYPDSSSPSGYVIEQWLTINGVGSGFTPSVIEMEVSLPIAFPTAVLYRMVSIYDDIPLSTAQSVIELTPSSALTKAKFRVHNALSSTTVRVRVVGY